MSSARTINEQTNSLTSAVPTRCITRDKAFAERLTTSPWVLMGCCRRRRRYLRIRLAPASETKTIISTMRAQTMLRALAISRRDCWAVKYPRCILGVWSTFNYTSFRVVLIAWKQLIMCELIGINHNRSLNIWCLTWQRVVFALDVLTLRSISLNFIYILVLVTNIINANFMLFLTLQRKSKWINFDEFWYKNILDLAE